MNKFLFIIAIVISSNAYSVIPEVKFDDWSVWEENKSNRLQRGYREWPS